MTFFTEESFYQIMGALIDVTRYHVNSKIIFVITSKIEYVYDGIKFDFKNMSCAQKSLSIETKFTEKLTFSHFPRPSLIL